MKRQTTRRRHSPRSKVLEVRVMSPRIAWFGFLRFLGRIAKVACLVAALTAAGWGVWRGVQHAFFKNPDFRLRIIDLNENPVIDEIQTAEAIGIRLAERPNLFEIDVSQATAKLAEQPGIAEARVERHLPATLVVRVMPRQPKAWLACPKQGVSGKREAGGLLVDVNGIAYPCPPLQLESAAALPIVIVPFSEDHPLAAGKPVKRPELDRCFRLIDAARDADPEAIHWIESVRQKNEWSLVLTTRAGTAATFSLGDHERQIDNLRAALDHAGEKGYDIATINLIPKHNIPITLRDGAPPPRAVPVREPVPAPSRRERDVHSLLNRN